MRDRSPIWIGLADLLLCIVSVVIVAVAPVKSKTDGIKPKAEYLITMESSVDIDADPDLWVIMPDKQPVFYGSREIGCATLDTDPIGFGSTIVTLADGSSAKLESDKETTALCCIEPGHYDVGVNLYAYRINGQIQSSSADAFALKCHVEIVALNPTVKLVFSKDVVLDRVGQTVNVASFDMDRDGKITLTDPPLEPITDAYRGRKQ
jgi:uncharacterized protein YfaP (DUF2135 family)